MGGMGAMGMAVPRNSIPMVGAAGPFGYIDMGGMFTILKVRRDIADYEDPGWYKYPPGTLSDQATTDELRRDGIDVTRTYAATTTTTNAGTPAVSAHAGHDHGNEAATSSAPVAGATYVCPMHPEVTSDRPDQRCPKCGMMLVLKS
jgi:hypothetical protein